MAHHDVLTGLCNRLLFTQKLLSAIEQAKNGTSFALYYIDPDRFKPVNDTFGHAVGDKVLKTVANRLQEIAREGDTVARLGGDEFVTLQPGIGNESQAGNFAKKIVQAMQKQFSVENHCIEIGASVGISVSPKHGYDIDRLMYLADQALYEAKGAGRGTYIFSR